MSPMTTKTLLSSFLIRRLFQCWVVHRIKWIITRFDEECGNFYSSLTMGKVTIEIAVINVRWTPSLRLTWGEWQKSCFKGLLTASACSNLSTILGLQWILVLVQALNTSWQLLAVVSFSICISFICWGWINTTNTVSGEKFECNHLRTS